MRFSSLEELPVLFLVELGVVAASLLFIELSMTTMAPIVQPQKCKGFMLYLEKELLGKCIRNHHARWRCVRNSCASACGACGVLLPMVEGVQCFASEWRNSLPRTRRIGKEMTRTA